MDFALDADEAEAVELLLQDRADERRPAHVVAVTERNGPVWHVDLAQRRPGQRYGYRAHAPWDPAAGLRLNAAKVLLDPYAQALGRPLEWHESLAGHLADDPSRPDPPPSSAWVPLAMVVESSFEWGDDRRPDVPWTDTVIYETHVHGLTMRHPDVPAWLPGTCLGLANDTVLDHLRDLGVATISLLPVHAFVSDGHLRSRGLHDWVVEMHLGGFSFDLASALAHKLFDVDILSPFFTVIQLDPVLSRAKLITGRGASVGAGTRSATPPGTGQSGTAAPATRASWAGHHDRVGKWATRVAGSSDLYGSGGRCLYASINFVTAHDATS